MLNQMNQMNIINQTHYFFYAILDIITLQFLYNLEINGFWL